MRFACQLYQQRTNQLRGYQIRKSSTYLASPWADKLSSLSLRMNPNEI